MRRPGGLFPDKGRLADQADRVTGTSVIRMPAWGGWAGLGTVAFLGLLVIPFLYVIGVLSPEFVNKLGYIATFRLGRHWPGFVMGLLRCDEPVSGAILCHRCLLYGFLSHQYRTAYGRHSGCPQR